VIAVSHARYTVGTDMDGKVKGRHEHIDHGGGGHQTRSQEAGPENVDSSGRHLTRAADVRSRLACVRME
jgi:hypothetical protein